jgi:hypothetical protein
MVHVALYNKRMPTPPMLSVVAIAVIALALGSCGSEEHVSPQVERALPAVQGTLLAHLCDPLDRTTGQSMSSRRRAQRQMKALLRALAATPEARVQTVRMTHDGDIHEELSVRRLAERHRGGLSEVVQTVDGDAEACARAGAEQLRVALEHS